MFFVLYSLASLLFFKYFCNWWCKLLWEKNKVISLGIKYACDAWPVQQPGIQIPSKMLSKEVNKINGNKTARKPDIIPYYHRDDCGCYNAMIGFWESIFSELVDKGASLVKRKRRSIITRKLQETQTIRTHDIITSLISFVKNYQIEDIWLCFILGTGASDAKFILKASSQVWENVLQLRAI